MVPSKASSESEAQITDFSRETIIDTSALVAVVLREEGYEALADTLVAGAIWLPTPVLVEFRRVTSSTGSSPNPDAANALLAKLLADGARVRDFDQASADAASFANVSYGKGNGRGGPLNILDLMVYGVAKVMGLPILCTGKDFAATDAVLHPASRPW